MMHDGAGDDPVTFKCTLPGQNLQGGGPEALHITALEVDTRSGKGYLAVGGDDGRVGLWDMASHKCVKLWEGGHERRVSGLHFTERSNLLYSAGHDGFFRARDLEYNQIVHSYIGTRSALGAMTVDTLNDTILLGSYDGSVLRLDLRMKQVAQEFVSEEGMDTPVHCMTLARAPASMAQEKKKKKKKGEEAEEENLANALLFVGYGSGGGLCAWDFRNEKYFREKYVGHVDSVNCVAVCNEMLYSGGEHGTRLFDIGHPSQLESLGGHRSSVTNLCFAGDYLFSSSFDRTVRAYNVDAVEEAITMVQLQKEEVKKQRYDRWLEEKESAKKKKGSKGKKKGSKGKKKK